MKRLIFILALAVSVTVDAAPKQPAKPITTPNGWVCRTKQQDLELRDWITGIQARADAAIATAKQAQASEGIVKEKLSKASSDGLQLAAERDKAVLDLSHVLKKLHLAKWIFSGLVTAAIVLLILQLKIPPPISIYIGLGAVAAANTLVWTLL